MGLEAESGGGGTKEGGKEEKFALCESIGHWPLRGRCPKMMELRPEFRSSWQIWAILLGFRPLCLYLGHIAWIWAFWQNLGQNRDRRMDGWMHGCMDGQIPPVFYRTSSPSRPMPKNELCEGPLRLPTHAS